MQPTAHFRIHRRVLTLSAVAIMVSPGLAPPAHAQGLFGRIDRTADRASAILGTGQPDDDATDAGLDGESRSGATDWGPEDARMIPDQPELADPAEPMPMAPDGAAPNTSQLPRR